MSKMERYYLDDADVTVEGTKEKVGRFQAEIASLYRLAEAVEAKQKADKALADALVVVRMYENDRLYGIPGSDSGGEDPK